MVMRKIIMWSIIIVLICSGVIGISIKVDSFSEAWDKVVDWKDEVLMPLVERGIDE